MKVTIEVKAKPGKFQELYQTLQALLPTIRKKETCRDCRIYRDMEDGEVFSLSVHWEDQASLQDYIQSSSGFALLGGIDLLSETARVKFGNDEKWEKIDSLKRMMKKP